MSDGPRTLRVEFATEEIFRSEYAANIANGGIFVPTRTPFTAREPVLVEITLGFCGERLALEGEVVNIVPPQLAETGATPGVAVQFTSPASEIRQRVEALAGPVDRIDEVAAQSGRRRAPRTPARVPATLEASGAGRIAGRTRNVSESGALISMEGSSVPVGEPVRLSITDPSSGEELVVRGRVARHIEGAQGGVSAVGIQFDEPDARKAGLAHFLKELAQAEHRRRLGGIEGAVSEIGIEHLLQMFGSCAPRGTLTLMRGGDEGRVVFEAGRLREALLGSQSGLLALSKLLSWREGEFEFRPSVDPGAMADDALPLEAAILRAMQLLDEDRRQGPESEDPGFGEISLEDLGCEVGEEALAALRPQAKLAIDDAALAAASQAGGLTMIDAAVVDLAAVGLSISKVLSIVPEPEDVVRVALSDLVSRGIVLVRS